MTSIVGGHMDVCHRVERAGCRNDRFDVETVNMLADQRAFGPRQALRSSFDAEGQQCSPRDAAVAAGFEKGRGAGNGEIAVPSGIFRETIAVAVRPWLEADRIEKFLFAKGGLQQPFEPLVGWNNPSAARPDDDELGVKRRAHCGLFRRRIEMATTPADCATGASLDVANMFKRAGQQGQSGFDEVRRQHVGLSGHRADLNAVNGLANPGEVRNAVDVDQMIGCDHPEIHHRYQRLSARKNLCVVQAGQQRTEFLARLRSVILKGRCFHRIYFKSRNLAIDLMNASGACAIGAWPHPGISISSASGSALARVRAISGGVAVSRSPTTTSVGLPIFPMLAVRSSAASA